MLMENILTPIGSTLLSGAPLSWQSFIAREIVAVATPNDGHVIYLGDDISDGVTAVRQFGAWEKLRNRSQIVVQPNDVTGVIRRPAEMNGNQMHHFPPSIETFTPLGPHLAAIAYHGIRTVHELAKLINNSFTEYDVWPRIVVRDVSRKLSPIAADDHWLTWLPELSRLAPAQYLTVSHTGVRGAAVTQNKRPFTATWTLADGHENGPAGPRERVGERWNLSEVPDGRVIKLHGHAYTGDVLFDLYEAPKQKVAS